MAPLLSSLRSSMADDFGAALRKNFSKMSVNNGSSSSSLNSKRDRLADGLPGDSSSLGHADNLVDLVRAEVKEQKAAKRDRKTFCGHCGKHKDAGMRLQTCSLCKFVQVRLCVCFALIWIMHTRSIN